ncbi:MAG: hypothetical protein PHQ74_02675 [Crocinitomicaceae bacterium]|nr:hypothetical protein [Crocinitomicaceae bacterium]
MQKQVTVHTLRHSFATLPMPIRVLENDVNLRYIQSLLGNSSCKTTVHEVASQISLHTYYHQSNESTKKSDGLLGYLVGLYIFTFINQRRLCNYQNLRCWKRMINV